MNNLLCVGSVIMIKNDKRKYLIIGKKVKKDNKVYDYLCIEYPYGLYDLCEFKYFYDKDIEYLEILGNLNEKV